MTGPLGNSEFCFPRISLRFSGNKIHCSLRDQSLSVNCSLVCKQILTHSRSYKLVYLNGNNAAEGENNIKHANRYPSHELNSEELICTRHLNRYDRK